MSRDDDDADGDESDMWDFGTIKNATKSKAGAFPGGGTFTRKQAADVAGDHNRSHRQGSDASFISARFGTTDSGKSSSSSLDGGTVRQGANVARPALAGVGAGNSDIGRSSLSRQMPSTRDTGGSTNPIAARDYGHGSATQQDGRNSGTVGSRFLSAAEAYDAAANGRSSHRAGVQGSSEDSFSASDVWIGMDSLNIGGTDESGPSGSAARRVHGKEASGDSVDSMDPRTAASLKMSQAPRESQAQQGPLTALDTVLLPVLEQVSV